MEVLLFILITLGLAFISAILSKKYGKIWVTCTFVGFIVIANILANKIVVFFYWAVPAGVIVYSATFFLAEVLSEFYSKKDARQAVWLGFFVNIILVICIFIAIKWSAASFWGHQDSFEIVFGNTWRIVLASMIAYLLSHHYNIWEYCFLKNKTKGRFLWLRDESSTIISQFIDSTIFITIAFYGIFPIWPLIFGQFVVKIIIAFIDTPFLYLIKFFFDR